MSIFIVEGISDSLLVHFIGARISIIVSLSTNAAIVTVRIVFSLVFLIENVHNVEGRIAGKMNNPLLAFIVNKAEDLQITEN